MQNEIWKDVAGYEGLYQVSSIGRIKRIGTPSKYSGFLVGERILSPSPSTDAYLGCSLYKNGISRPIKVHRIVAQTFIPNPEGRPVVNHIDGNRQNNNVDNLEWVTHSENTIHYYNQSGRTRIKKEPKKLREDQVRQIRELYLKGNNIYVLGRAFKVTAATIQAIITYNHFSTVDEDKKYEYLIAAEKVKSAIRSQSISKSLNHNTRKLSDNDVLDIRKAWYENQPITRTILANKYGVGIDTISDIINRRTHKYLI